MGLDAVLQDIISAGEGKRSALLKEAKEESSRIVKEAQDKAKQIIASAEEKTEEAEKRLQLREFSTAELEGKRFILNAEKEILDSLEKNVMEFFKKIPPDKNEKYLSLLIEKAKKEIPSGHFYSRKEDVAFIERNSNYKLRQAINVIGGIRIENEDNSLIMDLTFDSILEEIFSKSLDEIKKILEK